MILYHYTCDHSRKLLGDVAMLEPAIRLYTPAERQQVTPMVAEVARFVWLTDLEAPVATALGLTSRTLDCDRTAHRYRVDDDGALIVRYIAVRAHLNGAARRSLEAAPGAMPMHWWVSSDPVRVVYDPLPVAVTT